MNKYRKSTIKDVARQAGVSTTTVSYFVSGRDDVCSAETAARIRAAVDLLHYTPSSLVSGMQKSVRHAIGACISSPWDSDLQFGGFFFERIWRGICEETDAADYSILRYPASVRTSDRCDAFLDGRVDGVLFHAHTAENARPAKIASAGMPIVLLTRSLRVPEGCASVFTDEDAVVGLALERLWELGHRRIAHLAGPVEPSGDDLEMIIDDIAIARLEAYRAGMNRRGAHRPDYVQSAPSWDQHDLTAFVATWQRLPEPPTAILCANDALAYSVLIAAEKLGWSVPRDLSVVGIDRSEDPRMADRPLATVDAHLENLGREAIRCLLRLMSGASAAESQVALGGADWIERGSVAPVRAR